MHKGMTIPAKDPRWKTSAELPKEGEKWRLLGRAGQSLTGFSVEVTVVELHERPKGLPSKKQGVGVRLPDGEVITVWVADISRW